jgi:hypothetical protein
MVKKNREERRHEKFGRGRASEHGGWPTIRPNPVFTGGEDATPAGDGATGDDAPPAGDVPPPGDATTPKDATAGRPDQDQTKATGPGTGGATEQAGRAPRREGTHAKNTAKG